MSSITIDSFQKDLLNHLSLYNEEGVVSRNSLISKRIQNIKKYYHDFNLECEIVRRILQKGIDKVNKTKGNYVIEIDEEDNTFVELAVRDIETPKESKSPIHVSKLSLGYNESQTSQKSIFDYNSDITDLELFKLTSNYQKIAELYEIVYKEKISLPEMQKRSEQLELSEKIIHILKDGECDLIRSYNNHNYHAERITSYKKLQIEYRKLLEQCKDDIKGENNKDHNKEEENKEINEEEKKEENCEEEKKEENSEKEAEKEKESNKNNKEDVKPDLEVLKMKMKDEKRRINEKSIQNMVDCLRYSAKLRSKLLKEKDTEICSRILLLIQNYFVLIRDDNENLPEPTLLIDSCHKIYDAVFETTESYKISQNKTDLHSLRLIYPHDILLEGNKEKKNILFGEFVNDVKNMRSEMSKADILYQKTYSKHFQSYYLLFEKAVNCCSKSLTNDINNYNKLESSLEKVISLHGQYGSNISNISVLNDTTLNNQPCITLLKEFIDKCNSYYTSEIDKYKPDDIKEEKEEDEKKSCSCSCNNNVIGIQYFYKYLKTDDEYKAQKYWIEAFKAIYNTEIVWTQFREIIKILVEEGFSVEFHSCIHKLLSKMKELKPYGKFNNYNTISQNIIEEASSRIVLIIDLNTSLRQKMEDSHTQLTSCLNDIRTMTIRLKNYVVEEDLFYYEIYCRLEYLSRLLVRHIELCDRKVAKSRKIEEVLQQMYELWWTDSDSRIIYRVITTEIPQIEALTYSRPSCSEIYLNPNPSPSKYVFGRGIKIAPEPSSDLSLLITGPPLPTPFGYEVMLESLLWNVESYQYYYPNMRLELYNQEINELLHIFILVNNKKVKMYDTQISIYQKYILSHMNDIDLLMNAIIDKELLLKANNKYTAELDKYELIYHENTILYDLCGIDCLKLFEQIELNLDGLKNEYKEFIKTSTYHFNKMRRLHNLLVLLIKERIKEIKDINENNEIIYKEICEKEDEIDERIKNISQYKKMNEEKYNELMKYLREEKVIIENLLNEGKKKIKVDGSCFNTTSKNQMNVLLEKWNNKQDIQMNNSKLPFKDME